MKRESKIGADICYLGYVVKKPEYDINSVNPLYLIVRSVLGRVEKINGTNDRYLAVDDNDGNKKVLNVFDKLWKFIGSKINELLIASLKNMENIIRKFI